ncbi:MAG: hypothetical protein DRO87_08495 [Candidatus Thorarchaeota archaeon]|nr:MAG: hypothetical protein DRO87_08495 [Candidatus Thorarchaeota archaeon]
MKILQALKKIKKLDRKIEKYQRRIQKYCSFIVEPEDPPPAYSSEDIRRMQQAVADLLSEKVRIRVALHLTNVKTSLNYCGRNYTIDELLLLQNVDIPERIKTLKLLRRREKGGVYRDEHSKQARVVIQYDPRERDKVIEELEDALSALDDLLDNANIETDVIGLFGE